MLTDGSFTGQNPLCVRKTLRGNDIQIGPSHSMNFRTCSVVQRFGFVFVITDSCNGQTHGQTSNPVPHSLFESTGSSEGLEFTSLWNVLVGSLLEDPFPCFFLSLPFPTGQGVEREVHGFIPLILRGAKQGPWPQSLHGAHRQEGREEERHHAPSSVVECAAHIRLLSLFSRHEWRRKAFSIRACVGTTCAHVYTDRDIIKAQMWPSVNVVPCGDRASSTLSVELLEEGPGRQKIQRQVSLL